MKITRRGFIGTTSLTALGVLIGVPERLLAEEQGRFAEIRRGIGTFTAAGGTIGWLLTPSATVVVDSQMPQTATVCLSGLQQRSKAPIRALINTHHHRDHTGGNGVFRPAVKGIVAQENVPRLQREAAERRGTAADQAYADVTFHASWNLDLASEKVIATFRGPAHTGGDASVHFVNANVVHVGDLVFNRWYPFIDRPGGASIAGWIRALEQLHEDHSDDTVFIFGHGSKQFGITGTRSDLLVQRDFFAALLEHVRKGLAAGKSRAEITAAESFAAFPDHVSPGTFLSLPKCLEVAHDELTSR